uniref:Gustatory receptor n=1 Tax=Phlebotomus papatasi TaxID=29031 RepID=A0A3F2ZE90_PHLPP
MFLQHFRIFSILFLYCCICPFIVKKVKTDFIVHQSCYQILNILTQYITFAIVTYLCAHYGFFVTKEFKEDWDVIKTSGFVIHAVPIIVVQINLFVVIITARQHAMIFQKIDCLEKDLLKLCDIPVKFDGLCRQTWLEIIIAISYTNILLFVKLRAVYSDSIYIIFFNFCLGIVDLEYIMSMCHFSFLIRGLQSFLKSIRITLEDKKEILTSLEYIRFFRNLKYCLNQYVSIKTMINKTFGTIFSIDIIYDFFVLTFTIYLYLRITDTCNTMCITLESFIIGGKLIKMFYFTEQIEKFYRELEELQQVVVRTSTESSAAILQTFLHSNNKKYFTAAGFFDINYGLVYQFLTTCFTYMVILFQFESAG